MANASCVTAGTFQSKISHGVVDFSSEFCVVLGIFQGGRADLTERPLLVWGCGHMQRPHSH